MPKPPPPMANPATPPHVIIVGNGIAGVTCARHLRKQSAEVRITMISSETAHFFSRPALMYIYMGHMTFRQTKPYADDFWRKNRITCCLDHVEAIDPGAKTLRLRTHKTPFAYDALVLATGSQSRFLNWQGQNLHGVQGLYSYGDLKQMQATTATGVREAVVIGGGLIGVELAEMLHSVGIGVRLLVREAGFWDLVLPPEEAAMVGRHIEAQTGVSLSLQTEVAAFEGDANGKLQAVRCKDGQRYGCQFAGVSIGVAPRKDLAERAGLETKAGILVDELLRTSAEGVYAIGDCAELRNPPPHRRAVEAVWYVGRMMGETLAATLTGTRTPYRPDMWFNSAKFFDLEYQTYGAVPADLPPTQDSLYWAHATKRASLRIVFDKATRTVLGCNALGIRQRHAVWAAWINAGCSLETVLHELEQARFDSEFSLRYEPLVRALATERQLLSPTPTVKA